MCCLYCVYCLSVLYVLYVLCALYVPYVLFVVYLLCVTPFASFDHFLLECSDLLYDWFNFLNISLVALAWNPKAWQQEFLNKTKPEPTIQTEQKIAYNDHRYRV